MTDLPFRQSIVEESLGDFLFFCPYSRICSEIRRVMDMKKLLLVVAVLAITFSAYSEGIKEAQTDLSGLRIASPSGAPALALASLAAENPDQYTFIAAETITAEFANATSDFIVAPVNAGAKLYRMGRSSYRLAAVVSWGNLFFASQRPGFTAQDIDGADIVLFGENTINSSVALAALERNGISPKSVSYLASAANTQQLLLTDSQAIVLTAEPALTAAMSKKPQVSGISVNNLFGQPFTQAGLFVRSGLEASVVAAYLEKVRQSCGLCTTDLETVAAAAVSLEILPNLKVALTAIPNCAVRYLDAWEAKPQVESTAALDLVQFGGALPADDFYYGSR